MSKRGIVMSLADVEAHQKKHGFNSSLVAAIGNHASEAEKDVISASKTFRLAKQPNKTENEFGRLLEARVSRGEFVGPVRFEAVKLRVAGNCYYTPDWMVIRPATRDPWKPVFFEVKGAHIWDDSKVKFRAAAESHSWADFEMWQKKQGDWRRIL